MISVRDVLPILSRYRKVSMFGLLVAALILPAWGAARAEDESHVVGRLFGPVQSPPAGSAESVELTKHGGYLELSGFRFVGSQSG